MGWQIITQVRVLVPGRHTREAGIAAEGQETRGWIGGSKWGRSGAPSPRAQRAGETAWTWGPVPATGALLPSHSLAGLLLPRSLVF